MLSSWNSFYVMMGSSAAALTGLVFIVITLIRDQNRGQEQAQRNVQILHEVPERRASRRKTPGLGQKEKRDDEECAQPVKSHFDAVVAQAVVTGGDTSDLGGEFRNHGTGPSSLFVGVIQPGRASKPQQQQVRA